MAEFTTLELAMLCEKTERTVQRWIAEGTLPAQRIRGNRYEVDEKALERLLPPKVANSYLEKIEALEVHIVELASRVSTLETVITTMQQEQRAQPPVKMLRPPRATCETKPDHPQITPAGVPPGAIKMRTFAEKHHPLTRDWLMPLIESDTIPGKPIPYGREGRHQYWFLPEHLPLIVAYIRAHPRIPFGQCDDPQCPCHINLV